MTGTDHGTWDPRNIDVVVLGTGGAGLTAALTAAVSGAAVAVYEKSPTVGGTTAVSGGIVWIPAHHRSPEIDLPVEDAMAYLRAQSFGAMDDELWRHSCGPGQSMIDFVEANSDATIRDRPRLPGLQAGAAGR